MKRVYSEVVIYGLVCPINDMIMYVGGSVNENERLYQHMKEAERGHQSPRHEWIRELQKTGMNPSVKVIERCTPDNWREREKFWIKHYHFENPKLKNTTPDHTRKRREIYNQEVQQVASSNYKEWTPSKDQSYIAEVDVKGGKLELSIRNGILEIKTNKDIVMQSGTNNTMKVWVSE